MCVYDNIFNYIKVFPRWGGEIDEDLDIERRLQDWINHLAQDAIGFNITS